MIYGVEEAIFNNSSLGGNHSLLAQQYSEGKPMRGEFPRNKKDVSTR